VSQDGLLERPQIRSRLAAQLFDQPGSGVAINNQGVGLTATPVQRQHQLAMQPFTQRLFSHQPGQFGDQILMATGGELGVDSGLPTRPNAVLPDGRSPAGQAARR
jgi:hypothetical protein